ncbi:hypothetical protein [Butyrivibrio proteoclasticus]|uniref:hypothetical protein n=1 Tax=Butyrivibrio proteoclasticus TaxID=43305 RepID=UPI0009443237|nr:hypothetical protein [Butyrivibrio proteoclasticus]
MLRAILDQFPEVGKLVELCQKICQRRRKVYSKLKKNKWNVLSNLQQHQAEQQKNILEMRKAIRDYCEAAQKVSAEYQQMAIDACLREIVIQVAKNDTN